MWIREVKFSMGVVSKPLRPIEFPHLSVNFNFWFNTKDYNYLIDVDSSSGANPQLLPFTPVHHTTAAAHVIFRESLSYDAVEKAIPGHVRSNKRLHGLLAKRAWETVVSAVGTTATLPKYVELNVDLSVWIKHLYVDVAGGMAVNGWSRLRICSDPGETCCSKCTKEIGDSKTVGLRMACEHVFHGGCIVPWLLNNHDCPLCDVNAID